MSSETSNVAPPTVRSVDFAEAELNVLRQLVKDDYRKSLKYADKLKERHPTTFNPDQAYARSSRLSALYTKLGGHPVDLIIVKTP